MTGRPHGGALVRSPLETAGMAVALLCFVGLGLLWGTGVLVGSILGAMLPGTVEDGIATMVGSFPDVGRAWQPAIPSGLVWTVAAVTAAAFTPLAWRLTRAGRLAEEGAQWATNMELRRAGLLVSDRPLPHALPEEPSHAK